MAGTPWDRPETMNAGLLTSNSAEWSTPQDLFDEMSLRHGPFDLDPAAAPENAKCARYFTSEDDGLSQKWEAQHVWLNPPYGKTIRQWIEKAHKSVQEGECYEVTMLLPARTDTNWFHDLCVKYGSIYFLRGRIYFIRPDGSTGRAPFPSMVVRFEK